MDAIFVADGLFLDTERMAAEPLGLFEPITLLSALAARTEHIRPIGGVSPVRRGTGRAGLHRTGSGSQLTQHLGGVDLGGIDVDAPISAGGRGSAGETEPLRCVPAARDRGPAHRPRARRAGGWLDRALGDLGHAGADCPPSAGALSGRRMRRVRADAAVRFRAASRHSSTRGFRSCRRGVSIARSTPGRRYGRAWAWTDRSNSRRPGTNREAGLSTPDLGGLVSDRAPSGFPSWTSCCPAVT
jgi:hypothetical protein